MKRYIQFLTGGQTYRFLIDEELDQRLRSSLKNKYQFDANNNLIIDNDDITLSYQLKQQLISSLLKQIKTYDLTPDLQKKIDYLEGYINFNKTNIFASDLTRLNDLIGEASEIYNHVKANIAKAEVAKEQRELVKENVTELQHVIKNSDYEVEGVSSNISTVDDKLKELQAILEEVSIDEKLKEEVPIADINEAISRIVICSSMEDFIKQTGSNVNSYNLDDAIKNKSAKIVVPPTLKLEEVVIKVLSTCCPNQETFKKVITYVERKTAFQTETNKAFDSLREDLNIKGLNISNINYFGDQFLDEFINICNKTGVGFETMFADYFNGYSETRKYNSPLDRFIRQFIKYNGGDENTRGLLEALLVKKAISRNLISSKYNNYLQDRYRSLDVTGSGYIRFNEEQFNGFSNSIRGTSSISSSARANVQNNIGISGSSTLNSEIRTNFNKTDSLGLGFNSEGVTSVPNFEPRTDINNISGGIPPKKPGADILPKEGASSQRKVNPLSDAAKVKGKRSAVPGRKGNFGVEGEGTLTKTLEGSMGNPDLVLGFRKNNSFNPAFMADYDEDDLETEDAVNSGLQDGAEPKLNSGTDSNEVGGDDRGVNSNDESNNESLETPSNALNDIKNKVVKKGIIEFIKKNPIVLIIGGTIGGVLLLIFMIAVMNNDSLQKMGYYDQACNFNETNVKITNCYSNEEDKKEYKTVSLKEYVLGSLYAYTQGKEYNDEALKAAMVVLKTNALSYGNYNSSSKNVEVKSCSINNNFCDVNTGCTLVKEGYYSNVNTYQSRIEDSSLDNIGPASNDYISKLEKLYENVSNYIFVSSSYKSSISTLSSRNALSFNESTMAEFENLATSENSFNTILEFKYSNTGEADNTVYRDSIFIGDSRMQGMLISGVINDSNTVYGVGYGYNWLIGSGTFGQDKTNAINGAINGAKDKMRDNASYNIVIWLGVNDYTYRTANTYFEKYKELATGEFSNHEIYIVAIGPVDDSKATTVNNEGINNFNSNLESLITESSISNLHYINLDYNVVSYDRAGLHYGSSDYKNIYNIINSNLDNSISSNKTLYNLNDYCTYYNVTKNEAYWWPVGSKEATTGNIYGGTPVSVNITSYFGPRFVLGQYDPGHGAVDIGVAKGTPVIATKDGTVNYINTGCTEGNHACGGTYGNHIKIDHGNGIESLYAHLSEVKVSNGATVTQGQLIGYSGNTGRSTGPHLHFEIRVNGTRVDPLNYVSATNYRPVNVGTLNVDDSGTSTAENKANACKSLLASGYSKNAVIGILINISAEGAFNTTNLENCYEEDVCCKLKNSNGEYVNYGFCVHQEIRGFGSDTLYTNGVDSGAYSRDKFINDHAGYGLIQWTSSGRKAGLYDYAKSQNKSIGALSVQLEYLIEEIKGYPVTYKYITGNYSAYDIANNFCLDFERPANKSTACPARANNYLNEFTNYVNNNCS